MKKSIQSDPIDSYSFILIQGRMKKSIQSDPIDYKGRMKKSIQSDPIDYSRENEEINPI
ncbi:MAG: hypothetical protein Q8N96_11630 [Methylovulum sp.]|nr:hypothetical protein [Methylovulum sp.]